VTGFDVVDLVLLAAAPLKTVCAPVAKDRTSTICGPLLATPEPGKLTEL